MVARHKRLSGGSICNIAITGAKAFRVPDHREASLGLQDSFDLLEKFVGGLE